MTSVTKRISMIKQPRGGYINPNTLEVIEFKADFKLNEQENIHPNLVGTVVDYLTRFRLGEAIDDAFGISLLGADKLNDSKQALKILNEINGLDDNSIINACKMVGYDVAHRSSVLSYKHHSEINPDKDTVENIKIMVDRCQSFFETYGPVVFKGFTFEGGYTQLVTSGDGDYLTKDSLWDIKVSISAPSKNHTLQGLIYYLMGKKSKKARFFDTIEYVGIYNPRLNNLYRFKLASIPSETIKEVSENIIGYY